MTKEPPPFVDGVAPGTWVLKNAEPVLRDLASIPGSKVRTEDGQIIVDAADRSDETGARVATILRDLGLVFSAGRDWSPVAYITWLRERGLVQGQFVEIYWTKLGNWHHRPF